MAERRKIERYVWVIVWMVFIVIAVIFGYLLLQDLETSALKKGQPTTAAEYRNLKISLVVIGLIVEGVLGFWIWRMKRVERAKYELVKFVALGKMTEEQAAKKLGVGPSVIRDAVKELKEEGVVE